MIRTALQALPASIRAFSYVDFDCPLDFVIVINSNLSEKAKHDALAHEIIHILGNDLFSESDIDSIEKVSHQLED